MKITLSYSGGTPCGYYLASQFDKRGYLGRLYTSYYSKKYPRLTTFFGRHEHKEFIDTEKVYTNLKACFYRKILLKTMKLRKARRCRDRFRVGDMLDRWVAKQIKTKISDVILIESHQALHTIRKAKKMGIVTFLDRTNSHIELQEKIDSEELKRLGMKTWHDYKDTDRGLKEYEEVDFITVPSTFVKKGFIQKGFDPKKIIVVPLGIDTGSFKKVDKKDNIFRIIYCGGISHRKGIVYLLEAVSSLKLKNSEVWLIGRVADGMSEILSKYEGLYKIVNYVASYELYKYYSQGSVFVLPSLEDSFGLVIIEAMACGLPAIVTTNTAAGDVVREGLDGFVVSVKDVNALKEKILFFYKNKNMCKDMGNNAIKRVHDQFTDEAFATRMYNALKDSLVEI
jgi:glycosyltransferase involved in cell wall biosynthesis